MPRYAAAIKRRANITESKVQRVALQILNQKRMACHSQPFLRKADNLSWFKMMQKKGAAYGVKTVVAEGKRQSVSADGWDGCCQDVWERGPE